MQQSVCARIVGALILLSVIATQAATSAFLVPLQTEIANEIAFLSDTNNAGAGTASELRVLNQARALIDRRRRGTLQTDLLVLTTLSSLLSRSSNSATFAPLIEDALQNYSASLQVSLDTVDATIQTLPESGGKTVATNSLDQISALLDQADAATSTTAAARLLSRASLRLVALQTLVDRLGRTTFQPPPTTSPEFRAFINGQLFQPDSPPAAIFNSAVNVLTISGTQTSGGSTRTISLTFGDVRPGTTTHLLGDVTTGSYAIYTTRGTNTVGYTSSSGSSIVTIDRTGTNVTGSFSFVGVNRTGLGSSVQVSGGRFSLPLQ